MCQNFGLWQLEAQQQQTEEVRLEVKVLRDQDVKLQQGIYRSRAFGAVVFRCRGFGRGHDILMEAQLQARIA